MEAARTTTRTTARPRYSRRLAPLELPGPLCPGETFTSSLTVRGVRFERTVVCTPWLTPGMDLAAVLRDLVADRLEPGDLVAVTEKAVVVTTGRGVPASMVPPGRLASFVASHVRPVGNSRGLSIPEKAQLVIDLAGRGRIIAAIAASALTRPTRIRGAFYVVAGYQARCMDGMRPPYGDMLLPPLPPRVARSIASQLTTAVGHPVAIVDMNDRGGSVRAVAGSVISRQRLAQVLADNPMGQRDQATPIAIIRQAR